MLSVAESSNRTAGGVGAHALRPDPRSPPDPEPDRAPARLVPVVHREGPPGAVRRDQPDQGLHRQGDGAPVPRLRVRRPEVLRGGVPDEGPDVLAGRSTSTSSS